MVLFDNGEEGLKSIHILFTSFVFVICYFVWKSTQVREIGAIGAIPLGNFGANNSISRCWSQAHLHFSLIYSSSVRRSSSVVSNISTATGSTSEENLTNSVENITDSIFVEASQSYHASQQDESPDEPRTSDGELTEEEQIIREMDRDLPDNSSIECNVRRRNLQQSSPDGQPSTSSAASENSQQKEEDKISIKLKYLNDEIKTVNAFLNETVGNFKRWKHFSFFMQQNQ